MDEYFKKTLDNKDKIWSTYWSFTIAKNKALCISPFKNLIQNIGFDGSGTTRYKSFKITTNLKSYNSKKIIHSKKINYNVLYDQFFLMNMLKKLIKEL